nr:tripartite tricarboxylate transporter substrate-binding protein [Bordetella sp. 15P40C-2]
MLPGLVRANRGLPELIKIVVPFSPGGSNDVFARALAQQISQTLNVNCIVENKAGAGGAIGAMQVARSAPDGSTLLLTSNSMITSYVVQANPMIDPIRSFSHVAILNKGPSLMVVSGDSPYRAMPDLIEAVKAGRVQNYGSAGIGSSAHLAGEMLNHALGSNIAHVPYRGMSNVAIDLTANSLDFVITTVASVSGQLRTNQLKAIAVTSPEPSPFFPGLPPMAQYLPGYDVEAWWGVFAPAGTAPEILAILNQNINNIASNSSMVELFKQEATAPTNLGLDDIEKFLIAERDKWGNIAKSRKIEPV